MVRASQVEKYPNPSPIDEKVNYANPNQQSSTDPIDQAGMPYKGMRDLALQHAR